MATGFVSIVLATLIWGLLAHVDCFLVNEKGNSSVNNIKALMIFSTLVAGGAMLVIKLALSGFRWPEFSLVPALLSIAAAFAYIMFTYLELCAFADNDASIVVAFSQLSPVFSYVAALLFLGENLTFQQVTGSIVVVIATLFLTADFSKKDQNRQHKVRALILMIMALVCFTAYSLLVDYANEIGDYDATVLWFQVGTVIPGLILICLKSFRQSFVKRIKKNGKRYLTINVMNEVGNSTAVMLRSFAIMFMPLALLDTLDVMGVAIFTLLFGFAGTKMWPKFFDEDMSRSAVLQKVVCIAISLIGVAIIFI